MTSTPSREASLLAGKILLSHISPPPNVPIEEYKYTKLPPLPRGHGDPTDGEQGEEDTEGRDIKSVLWHQLKNKRLVYYVELENGMAERRDPKVVQKREDLLATYEIKRRNGKLKAFNPVTDVRLNPLKITISLQKTQLTTQRQQGRSPSYEGYSTLTSLPDSESHEDDDASYSEGSDTPRPLRRSNRMAVAGPAEKLGAKRPGPSPKKTRARARERRLRGEESESESEDESDTSSEAEVSPQQTTRSGRTVKALQYPTAASTLSKKRDKKQLKPHLLPNLELGEVLPLTKDSPSEHELAKLDPLHAHRDICEKCAQKPAHLLPKKRGRKKGRQRGKYDDKISDDGDEKTPEELGGWLKCTMCCRVGHWDCVSALQRLEVIRAVRAKSGNEIWQGLGMDEMSVFRCGACLKGAECTGCGKKVPEGVDRRKKRTSPVAQAVDADGDVDMDVDNTPKKTEPSKTVEGTPAESQPLHDPPLLFRCERCKRASHYSCLPNPPRSYALQKADPLSLDDLAFKYHETWECDDCERWRFPVELILAWRPLAGTSTKGKETEVAHYKDPLKREYLVKWASRSFERVEWVPHNWLSSTHGSRLKNFLDGGRKVELLAEGGAVAFETSSIGPPGPEPEVEARIPEAWKRVDRLLDVKFWKPPVKTKKKPKPRNTSAAARKRTATRSTRNKSATESDTGEEFVVVEDEDASGETDQEELKLREPIMREGEEPEESELETAEQRQSRLKRMHGRDADLGEEDIDDLAWCYIKWEDLGYEQATWDSPYPRQGPRYPGLTKAFLIFLQSRRIHHKTLTPTEMDRLDRAYDKDGKPEELTEQPKLGQDGTLFPFQLQGVSWLWLQWWQHRSSILADEMGLGKTVQVITFLELIFQRLHVSPILIVVPNSTITNWTREFARWAPTLHVTAYLGEAASRKVIREYELFQTGRQDYHHTAKRPELRTNVIITTYEAVTNAKDASERSVFNSVTRWEVLVVDESQKLKNDASLIFKRLSELNSAHRILMTGTPLNNNIRELFNLMHFLDPPEWHDVERLEREYAELDEEKIKQLHGELKPYFLRRIKEDELDLPARNEVIVPVSMSTLQKQVYRGLLSRNAELIQQLVGNISASTAKVANMKKGNLNNLLMELRKCLQHPYLVSGDLEPKGLPDAELHRIFVEGSAKLVLLKTLLPKLKERGHRVLLFSQFVIALNIIEDFCIGEGFKYMRLDGNTKQSDRQKGLDQFNQEGSEYFIYLLTTRAGGVGINLTSADTVIVFDPDFNPHMDHQAIARAHRIGQTKPVLVFKLMVKDSAEEKIIQVGKKKLVLDHLIVQKMDIDEEGMNDVQTILSFGARALFEEDASRKIQDITHSEKDIVDLIIKTETDGRILSEKKSDAKSKGLAFDFAKVWEANKGVLEELKVDEPAGQGGEGLDDFWASVAKRAAAEEAEKQSKIVLGRGGKRAAAAAAQKYAFTEDIASPIKKKKKDAEKAKSQKARSDADEDAAEGSDFVAPSQDTVSDDDDIVALDGPGLLPDDVDVYLPPEHKSRPRVRSRKSLVDHIATMDPVFPTAAPIALHPPGGIIPPQANFNIGPVPTRDQFSQHIASQLASSNVQAFHSSQQFSPQPLRLPHPPSVTRLPQPPSVTRPPQPPSVTRPPQPPSVTRPPQPPSVTRPPHPPSVSRPIGPPPLPNLPNFYLQQTRNPASSSSSAQPGSLQHHVSSPIQRPATSTTYPSLPKRARVSDSDDDTEDDADSLCRLCKTVHAPGRCPQLEDIVGLQALKARILASDEPNERRIPALTAINDRIAAFYERQAKEQRTANPAPPPRIPTQSNDFRTVHRSEPQLVQPPLKKQRGSTLAYPSSGGQTVTRMVGPNKSISYTPVSPPPVITANRSFETDIARVPGRCPVCSGEVHPPSQCKDLSNSALAIKRAITRFNGNPAFQDYVEELKQLLQKRHDIPYSNSTAVRTASGSSANASQGHQLNTPRQSLSGNQAPRPQLDPVRVATWAPSAGPGLFCRICGDVGHSTKACPKIGTLNDTQLKTEAKKLKRLSESSPVEVNMGLIAIAHRRAAIKADERMWKRQGGVQAPPPEIIELSD